MRLFALALLAGLLFGLGCTSHWTAHHGSVDGTAYEWYYYPEVDVYHSPSHRIYYYRVTPTQWVEATALPVGKELRGRSVKVADTTRQPFHRNHEHIEAYRANQ